MKHRYNIFRLSFISAFSALLCCFLSPVARAQYYTFGNDPSRARWSSITTDNFKLIYPSEIDSLARVYLYNLEKYRPLVNEGLNIDPKPVPVVLHPYTVLSNGSVCWAPKNVSLITTPDAYGSTPQPWINELVIHELRHVGQIEHFTKGFYRPFSWFIGEQSPGLGVALFADTAMLEGDAVMAETELSSAGRGRSAEFFMYMRSLYLNDVHNGWERAMLGSYKHKVIGSYPMGFTLVAAARLDTRDYDYMGRYYHAIGPQLYDVMSIFQKPEKRSLKSLTWYLSDIQDKLSAMWKNDLEQRRPFTRYDTVKCNVPKLYCDYVSPIYNSVDDEVIALKKGLEYTAQLVKVDSAGTERFMSHFDPYSSDLTKVSGGRIYWSETDLNGVNGLQDYSDIHYFDIAGGHRGHLTRDTRYFNPSPSPDGGTLAVVEYPVKGSSFLVTLDSHSGELLDRVEAPFHGQLLNAVFFGGLIYCSVILDDGVAIYSLSEQGEWRETVPPQSSTIRHLSSCSDGLCFSCDLDGVMNVYIFDPSRNQLYRLTNSYYGADYPSVDDGRRMLYYSEFSPDGYRLAKVPVDSLPWHVSFFDRPASDPLMECIEVQRTNQSNVVAMGDSSFLDPVLKPSKKYNKFLNSMHIHSWAPVYYNVDRIMAMEMEYYYDLASLGATVYSQNELGTLVTMLGYSWHGGFHAAHGKISGHILDFDIELSADFNDRFAVLTKVDKTGEISSQATSSRFIKTKLDLAREFNFYHGGWYRMLIPQLNWTFSNDLYKCGNSLVNKNDLRLGARYYQVLPVAHSQIFPRWGFGLSAYFSSPVSAADKFDRYVYSGGYFYLPGFTRLQGLKISGEWQMRFADEGDYVTSSTASLPRGFSAGYPGVDYAKITADYAIPIWLGDVSIPNILYFKRLRLIPFSDFALNTSFAGTNERLCSFGTDALVDFNIFRFAFGLSAGVRYARTSPWGESGWGNSFSFLFSVDL